MAFFMTANTAGALYAATSTDLIHWDVGTEPWCAGRAGHFDHGGIAAGPQAERLSDGNLLYDEESRVSSLYNIQCSEICVLVHTEK